jgi:flagellar FliL protein
MAQAQDKPKDASAPAGTSAFDFAIAAVAAIVVGIAGGGCFGYFVVPVGTAPPAKEAAESAERPAPATGRFPNDALEIQIPSIIVDMESEPKTRLRLDVSIIVAHGTSESGSLKNEVREDIIAFLKGISVTDIQGVRGFQHLREQLDDRAKIRGRGAILGLLIGGLVLE